MPDTIYTVDIPGIGKVPFLASDYYYGRTLESRVKSGTSRKEAIEFANSANSRVRSIPIVYYSNGEYPRRVISALGELFPNKLEKSYNSTDLIKLFDEEFTLGALLAVPYNTDGTQYQIYPRPSGNFPLIDTQIGRFGTFGNDNSYSINYTLSLVPEGAVIDGVIQFSEDVMPHGVDTFTISAGFRTGGGSSEAAFAGPFVSLSSSYNPVIEIFNGTLTSIFDPNDPYAPGPEQGVSGGNGSFNDGESDNIRLEVPNGSAGPDTSKLGLYTRYLMTGAQVSNFGDYLYADDIVEAITNGIMKALFDSPAEAVISLMHYPFNVSSLVPSSASDVYYGNIPTGQASSGIMNKSSARIEWGTLSLTEYWGNFLDYAPHTKIDLYLPWCVGSVPIDPHECLPGSLEVITNIEFDKGTCIHSVIGNKGAVIGTYSGVVGTQIPVTALDSSGKALAFVTAAVAGAVTAGATGAATSAGIRAANSLQTTAATAGMSFSERNRFVEGVIRQAEAPYRRIARGARNTALASSAASFRVPPNITRNGSFSGNGASLAVQVPFIIISRPTQSVPQNYGRHYGYPSNIYSSLGSLAGYTEVGAIHLDGFSCTVEERNEIEELLMGGVML